ncbi:MAG: M48 family metalloprotease [Actinomycetota bacterium]|nr:M48 family metalloprotease [Actinomycetota bacterium]
MREHVYLYDTIASNRRRIALGVFVFFAVIFVEALVVAVIAVGGEAFEWRPFLMVFGAASGATLLFLPLLAIWAYYRGKEAILKLFRVETPSQGDAKKLRSALAGVCMAAGAGEPETMVISTSGVNAISLARGYKDGLILVTRGAVENLSRDELEALLAHEVYHIVSRDTWMWMLGLGLSAFLPLVFFTYLGMVSKGLDRYRLLHTEYAVRLIFLITICFIAIWFILAAFWIPLWFVYFIVVLPRNRDYLADAQAVLFTRNPDAVLSVVAKADIMRSDPIKWGTVYVNHMFFNQPLEPPRTFTRWITDLFDTHPAAEKRMERIRSMG